VAPSRTTWKCRLIGENGWRCLAFFSQSFIIEINEKKWRKGNSASFKGNFKGKSRNDSGDDIKGADASAVVAI
jgi:hypothetical protein